MHNMNGWEWDALNKQEILLLLKDKTKVSSKLMCDFFF